MTTLTKNANFDFDPGSPFVPARYTTVCTGKPDDKPPSPPVSLYGPTSPSPGYPTAPYGWMPITGRDGQTRLYPRVPAGSGGIRLGGMWN